MQAPIVVEREINWGDMDALGHVNNTVFFRWFEDVRIAAFDAIGIGHQGGLSVGPILATTTCDFLAPLHYPGRVRIGCRFERLGTTSFVQAYEVEDASTGSPVARGTAVVVMVDYELGRKVPLPEPLRKAIEALS